MSRSICLNADIGELPGEEGRALDRAMLDIVSRCSIACGGHAGDADSMYATLRAARARQVAVGVHPSYPDKRNFGRKTLKMDRDTLVAALRSQVRTFLAIARETGVTTEHLKPHGALYNEAAADESLARLIVQVSIETNIPAIIGPPNSRLSLAAGEAGVAFLAEGFADRRYASGGTLVPRSQPDAMIIGPEEQAQQVLLMLREGVVQDAKGGRTPMQVQTVCLHGDTPGAVEMALALREVLRHEKVAIRAATVT